MQCILSELMGENSSANIVFNGSSLFGDFVFCKDLNFIMINYKFAIHDAPHFALLYFEGIYNMMSIYTNQNFQGTSKMITFYYFKNNLFEYNVWSLWKMKRNKTKCFHKIKFYSSTLLQNASTYMSPTIENLQQLIARVSPVRTNNSTASTPNRFHVIK